jgi:hypothetical protein
MEEEGSYGWATRLVCEWGVCVLGYTDLLHPHPSAGSAYGWGTPKFFGLGKRREVTHGPPARPLSRHCGISSARFKVVIEWARTVL